MVATDNTTMLTAIFGAGNGDTPEERAISSTRVFVRSLSQIAEDSPEAKGRRLSAIEALETYGLDVLREIASEGSALLCESPRAAGTLVSRRRELLGLEIRHVSNMAGVPKESVERLESCQRVPIRQAERIARALGLDERMLSWKSDPPPENERIAIRLRAIGDDQPLLTSHAVSAIAESSWVAATQLRLQGKLGIGPGQHGITTSANYGGPGNPAFKQGYLLASDARRKLGLDNKKPLESLREITEVLLGVPVIQAEMGAGLAGATVDIGSTRAIVLNLDGDNQNVLVRRSTVAHELGHFLYDPPGHLQALRVDGYKEIDKQPTQIHDQVEQRANAFGIELLAPRSAVTEHFKGFPNDHPRGLLEVMRHFGISYTAARNQIWNGLNRSIPIESLRLGSGQVPEVSGWEAREAYTLYYHPLGRIKPTRAGRFSAVVVRAAQEGHISWDSAAEMLESNEDDLKNARDAICELFPAVWT